MRQGKRGRSRGGAAPAEGTSPRRLTKGQGGRGMPPLCFLCPAEGPEHSPHSEGFSGTGPRLYKAYPSAAHALKNLLDLVVVGCSALSVVFTVSCLDYPAFSAGAFVPGLRHSCHGVEACTGGLHLRFYICIFFF